MSISLPSASKRPAGISRARTSAAVIGLVVFVSCSSAGTPAGPGDGGTGGFSGGTGGAATGGRGSGGSGGGSGGSWGSGGATSDGGASATGGAPATGGSAAGGSGGHGGGGGSAPGGGGSAGGEFGFMYRKPGATDVDWLCTFRQGSVSGHVYARFDQNGTTSVGIATIPVYKSAGAQLSVAGAPSELTNVVYEYGGGHNNDSLRFDIGGKTYKYYHSSFGFGFRKCQPMDCINVYAAGGTTPEIEGCTAARTLPEVCVPIKVDGTHDPLTDRFMKCPGAQ